MTASSDRWVFALALSVFVAVFLIVFPSTYSIDDECNILSLAFSLARGTVFLDEAGVDLDADLEWRGHRVSKFSPFHAGLLAPAVATRWRLGFLVTAVFFVWGAIVLRGMLLREGRASAWALLYFLTPGTLYYSRTLVAMVPAAALGLLGFSLLFRERPRPAGGAFALGVATLLHPWMAPIAVLIAVGWWLERAHRGAAGLAAVALGALAPAAALAAYNTLTTGSPFQNVYVLVGHTRNFTFERVGEFLPFYLASLAVAPLGGWAIFSPRWAGNRTLPITAVAVIVGASGYYYRDGLSYGIAGWIPGQRFLLPLSMLACAPAARWLGSLTRWLPAGVTGRAVALFGLGAFTGGFITMSVAHQRYLRGHEAIQMTVKQVIPEGALVVASDRAFKEFAPVNGRWRLRIARYGRLPTAQERREAYTVWVGPVGTEPPGGWFDGQIPLVARFEFAMGRPAVWIGSPGAR